MILSQISSAQKFFKDTVWNTPLNTLSRWEAFLYRQIRIWMITLSEFQKDKCAEKASALTYFSLLSIVPVMAMAFGVGQMFGLKEYVQSEINAYIIYEEGGKISSDWQSQILSRVSEYADTMLANSSGGIISGISALFLIYAVARLLNNIEMAFNHVWDTKEGRTLKRKLTDYMSVIFLGPLIIILSSSISVFIENSIQEATATWTVLGYVQPVTFILLKFIPVVLIWFLLFLVYVVFPNTAVKIRPAMVSAILAGSLFMIVQYAWIHGQVFLSNYSVVYGSFAALPLFLIWLQLSWTILLFGAEFAYAIQNSSNWTYSDDDRRLSRKLKKRLVFMVLYEIVNHFLKEDTAISFQKLTGQLYIPNRFIHEVLSNLERAGLIARVKTSVDDGNEYYQPAMDVNKLDVHTVLRKLDLVGESELNKLDENLTYKVVDGALLHIESYGKTSEGNRMIKDLGAP